MKEFDVFVTRDSDIETVRVWKNVEKGIRIFHGCVCFGTGASLEYTSHGSSRQSQKTCKKRYGFVPKEGTAYNVYTNETGKIVKKRVDAQMAFSDYPDPKGEIHTLAEIKEGCIEEIRGKYVGEAIQKDAIAAIRKMKKDDLFSAPKPCLIQAFQWSMHKLEYEFWQRLNDAEDIENM